MWVVVVVVFFKLQNSTNMVMCISRDAAMTLRTGIIGVTLLNSGCDWNLIPRSWFAISVPMQGIMDMLSQTHAVEYPSEVSVVFSRLHRVARLIVGVQVGC